MSHSPEHVGSDTLAPAKLFDEERKQNEAADDSDSNKKPLYPGVTVAVVTIMFLLALFTIKHNLLGKAIGNCSPSPPWHFHHHTHFQIQ